jgi:predicted ArsR family transcriptional regulator
MKRPGWRTRLLKSTRGQILALLRTENRTVNDLADALNLTDNAVRAHLLSLERDGLVQQHGIRPGTRKPHATYGLTSEAEHIFPKAYGSVLNHIVSVISKRLSLRELRAGMREVGRTMAAPHLDQVKRQNRTERIETALSLLNDLGGSAKLEESEGKRFVRGNGCPLSAVTASHPEACLIVESFLSEILSAPVKTCCEYGESPRCCFQIG